MKTAEKQLLRGTGETLLALVEESRVQLSSQLRLEALALQVTSLHGI